MVELIATEEFNDWLGNLRDLGAKVRIAARLRRVALGNSGDVKAVGAGVSELRIHYGPGYRVYIMQRSARLVILLCAGDKSTQAKDIAKAKQIAQDWED